MKHSAPRVRAFLFLPLLCIAWHQGCSQEKPQEKSKEAAAAPEQAKSNAPERKNPVKPTPENLAEAKKFFGYDCAMCHGATGDGKGDLAPSMGLKLNDWRDTSTVAGMSDGELFDLVVKGKGKMEGEGDRIKAEMAWKLVNYVRTREERARPRQHSERCEVTLRRDTRKATPRAHPPSKSPLPPDVFPNNSVPLR